MLESHAPDLIEAHAGQDTPAANGLHTIGDAAVHTGLSPKMIRYYESLGILTPQGRSTAGYRLYNEADLHALRFIRTARELGFSLKQIAELTDLWRDRHRASAEVKRLALAHIDALEAKAALLQSMAGTLRTLARHCHGDDRPDCPILEGLAGGIEVPGLGPHRRAGGTRG
ncbi:Cu(I)-responsive transcriptional regulator [Castellaniella sp. MT123]|uniref:Cu(I)-responsive transcriptional regulator n=1 Tax=Castellaniella sp. MT123 TaxID=3140381 RepID=UPI0031F36C4E